jgi:hypothetical protein
MLKLRTMMLLLSVSLGISACTQRAVGGFCDIAEPIRFSAPVARAVVLGDRAIAEKIDAQNRFGEQRCGWKT